MKPAATLDDFNRLNAGAYTRHAKLLQQLHYLRLTCRVEMSGKDLTITVAPALPPASYWLDRFDIEYDRNARFVDAN